MEFHVAAKCRHKLLKILCIGDLKKPLRVHLHIAPWRDCDGKMRMLKQRISCLCQNKTSYQRMLMSIHILLRLSEIVPLPWYLSLPTCSYSAHYSVLCWCSDVYTTKWTRSPLTICYSEKAKAETNKKNYCTCIVCVIMGFRISFRLPFVVSLPETYKWVQQWGNNELPLCHCIIIYITMIKIKHDKWQREITLVRCAFCLG